MAVAVKGFPREFEALRKSCQDLLEEMGKCMDCALGDEGDVHNWKYISNDLNEVRFRLNKWRTGFYKS